MLYLFIAKFLAQKVQDALTEMMQQDTHSSRPRGLNALACNLLQNVVTKLQSFCCKGGKE